MRARHGDAVHYIWLGAFIAGVTFGTALPFASYLMVSNAWKASRSKDDSKWLNDTTDWFYNVLTKDQTQLDVQQVLVNDDVPPFCDGLTDEGIKRVFFRTCESIVESDMRNLYIKKLSDGQHPITFYMNQESTEP